MTPAIALDLVERGVINARELVTHHFPLAKISDAYATAQKPEALKVIVTFDSRILIASSEMRRGTRFREHPFYKLTDPN